MPSLPAGTSLGPYVIEAPLGEGGMGEVYRARDTTLNRLVALKILPDVFAADPDRLSRFEREAQVLAQLNHPHIAQIYGFERSHRALAMELVEGDDLAVRLARGPLPLDEALAIAAQLADALEAAHEHGIVHRDLKPANIKVRADGTVKVLDFGLAKPGATGSVSAIDLSPTITSPVNMTAQGMILGTAAYMAPEQARGKPVDRRADIWAFGCVVYEMLAGRRPFDGETVTDLLAAVVTRDPDWSALPRQTPGHVARVLARCLAKDPRARYGDIGDARFDLEHAGVSAPPPAASRRWTTYAPWAIAAAAVMALAVSVYRPRADPPSTDNMRPLRFIVHPPEGGLEIPGSIRGAGSATISPDGRRLAMLATAPDGRLWIRDFSATEPTLIKGSSSAQQPFWSPDGRTLGFFGQRTLRKLDLDSGTIQDVGPAIGLGGLRGGSFGPDGTVLLKDDTRRGISRLSPGATTTTAATELDQARGDRAHEWPIFLPDGRQFLFLGATKNAETTGVYLGSLDSPETRFVARADSNAAYASGYLLYVRGGMLLAQPFDAGRGEVTGEPVTIESRVVFNPSINRGEFSVSQTGVLAHATTGLNTVGLSWFDRSGVKLGDVDAQGHMDIASDDRRVAADRIDPQTGLRDVWVFDVAGGQRTRLSFSAANDWVPAFSPDGTTVVYTSDRDSPGVAQLYQKAANGSGAETLLLETGSPKHHLDWSPDGRFLAFEQNDRGGFQDLWMLPMTGARTPFPFLQGPFREAQPSFSPDSKLLAYTSNESGVFEVYVQTFPASGGRWQISTNGGTNPLWRRDGKEMFYLSADGRIMALDIDLRTPSFGGPRPLFQTAIAGDTTTDHFAATSDGQRFLLQASSLGSRTGFAVVLNWLAELRK